MVGLPAILGEAQAGRRVKEGQLLWEGHCPVGTGTGAGSGACWMAGGRGSGWQEAWGQGGLRAAATCLLIWKYFSLSVAFCLPEVCLNISPGFRCLPCQFFQLSLIPAQILFQRL